MEAPNDMDTSKAEKGELEHAQTNQSDSPSELELQKEKTLRYVDLENKNAFKGDDSDGKIEWTVRKAFAAAFLAMLYTGSQILLYFIGGSLSFIVKDLKTSAASGWLPTANTLAIASVAPATFLFSGAGLLCLGCLLLGTAHSFGQALAGMALAGAGAGIGELTGLAGLAETVPVRYRGYSLAALTAFVFPFTPYVMYSQLLGTYHTWRWGPWISLIYNGATGLGLAFTYFPHIHARAEGFSYRAILKRIDFMGGFLSITGLTLFLVALQAGGYTHPWKSAYVLCTLLIGFFTIVAWIVWEWRIATHPMVPRELFQGQRVVSLAYMVAFVAGMNFFSMLNFWPLLISTVYDPDPVKVGLRGLVPGLMTTVGAIFFNAMLSTWRGGSKWILVMASAILCAFGGSLSVIRPDNEVMTIALGSTGSLGLGGVIVPSATVAMIAAPDALITTCAALSLSIRAVGGSIGYSIYYNIFEEKLKARLPIYVGQYAVQAGLSLANAKIFVETYLLDPTDITKIPGVTPQILAAAMKGSQWAYAESLRYVWWTSIAFGVLSMACAAMLPNTKKFQTNRVAVAL
ncbi:MFS general substrate transporter [Rhizodiscina lignyota]|uniref:MFS general substrate transporter n=1 Tax=Rhizodiscina lignyota TaxID=1504668 RepID=A0A9P4IE04_9PEZI|nr:MFS general substrate transporter [Rhizodiscina lignyota]